MTSEKARELSFSPIGSCDYELNGVVTGIVGPNRSWEL